MQRASVVGADESDVPRLVHALIDARLAEQRERALDREVADLRAGVPERVVHEARVAHDRAGEQRVRGRAGVVVVHADVVVGRVVDRPDRAAQAEGAEAALQTREAVAAGEDVPAIGQVDAALDLEDRLQARGEVLVVAEADARGVVHELVVRLVRDSRVAAVVGLDALHGDVDAPVDLELGRYRLGKRRHCKSGCDGCC